MTKLNMIPGYVYRIRKGVNDVAIWCKDAQPLTGKPVNSVHKRTLQEGDQLLFIRDVGRTETEVLVPIYRNHALRYCYFLTDDGEIGWGAEACWGDVLEKGC